MASETVRVTGYREAARAFKSMGKDAQKELRVAMLEAGRPVAEAARETLGRYQGASVKTIRPRASVLGAFVTQGAKKVTGKRGDFGTLQQLHVLEPALAENHEHIERSAENVLDILARRNGF